MRNKREKPSEEQSRQGHQTKTCVRGLKPTSRRRSNKNDDGANIGNPDDQHPQNHFSVSSTVRIKFVPENIKRDARSVSAGVSLNRVVVFFFLFHMFRHSPLKLTTQTKGRKTPEEEAFQELGTFSLWEKAATDTIIVKKVTFCIFAMCLNA